MVVGFDLGSASAELKLVDRLGRENEVAYSSCGVPATSSTQILTIDSADELVQDMAMERRGALSNLKSSGDGSHVAGSPCGGDCFLWFVYKD